MKLLKVHIHFETVAGGLFQSRKIRRPAALDAAAHSRAKIFRDARGRLDVTRAFTPCSDVRVTAWLDAPAR